jgi:hypothetical protein
MMIFSTKSDKVFLLSGFTTEIRLQPNSSLIFGLNRNSYLYSVSFLAKMSGQVYLDEYHFHKEFVVIKISKIMRGSTNPYSNTRNQNKQKYEMRKFYGIPNFYEPCI